MSAFRKLVLASSGGQEAGLYMPCDGLVLQQSAVFLTLGRETSLWSFDQSSLIFLFFPFLFCSLIQGPLMSTVLLLFTATCRPAGFLQA